MSKVFLSYALPDQETVRGIVKHFRQSGVQVWDPEIEILPGDDFTVRLKQGLESSDAMVVFLSPEAVQSREVKREIEYALAAEHLRYSSPTPAPSDLRGPAHRLGMTRLGWLSSAATGLR